MSEKTTTKAPEATGGFSLDTIDATLKQQEQGYTVHLRDHADEPMFYTKDGEERPVTWTIAGEYSERYRNAQRAARDRLLSNNGRTRNRIRRAGEDDAEDQLIQVLAEASLDWDGFRDGEDFVPFTRDRAKAILKQAPWIRAQVARGTSDHDGFFSPSGT